MENTDNHESNTALPPTAFPPERTRLQKAFPWFVAILASLLIGFLLTLFLLYIPAARECRSQEADLIYAQKNMAVLEVEVEDLQNQLDLAEQLAQSTQDNLNIEIENLNQDVEKAQSQLLDSQFNLILAKLQVNTAYARLALSTGNTLTAQQEMSSAADNLKALAPFMEGSQVLSVLETRLKNIRDAIPDDIVQAQAGLEMFNENLLRIETR